MDMENKSNQMEIEEVYALAEMLLSKDKDDVILALGIIENKMDSIPDNYFFTLYHCTQSGYDDIFKKHKIFKVFQNKYRYPGLSNLNNIYQDRYTLGVKEVVDKTIKILILFPIL